VDEAVNYNYYYYVVRFVLLTIRSLET